MKKILHTFILLLLMLPFMANAQCPGGETEITVTITQDKYGNETTWVLTDAVGDTIISGGPYELLTSNGTVTHVVDTCVTLAAELTFIINDAYGDGICAGYGDGWYSVKMFDYIFVQGCDFGKKDSTTFIVTEPPNVNVVLEELDVPLFTQVGNIEINGIFSNKGADTIKSVDINWSVNNGTIKSQSLSNLSIASHDTYEFTHDSIWNASDLLSTNNLKVWLSNPNGTIDEVPENDTISKKIFILDEVAEKRVLIEHHTQASCGPCAGQNPVLDSLINIKPNTNEWLVSHIAYHTSWPGDDPMYDFNLANNLKNARVNYYGVGGVPNVVLGGNKFTGSPVYVTQNMIDTDWARPGLFDITADLTYANDSVYVSVELISLADFSEGEIVAHAVLIEDLEYTTAPGTNKETEFPDVMRYMFPDVNGTNLGLPDVNQIINLSFKHVMDTVVSEEMQLVVFVQNNDNKEIYGVYQLVSSAAPVVSFNVTNEAVDIPLTNDFIVTFDIPVRYINGDELTDTDTLIFLRADSIDGENVLISKTISDTKEIIGIKPVSDLEFQTTYYLGVGFGLKGYNKTAVAETSVSFTTKERPTVTATITPTSGATNVACDANITISFDLAVRLLNDDTITDPTSLITLKKNNQDGENVVFTASINTDKTLITIDPDSDLEGSQVYYISIGALVENEYNMAIEVTSCTFTTETTTGINENILSKNLKIYPNPVSDKLNLKLYLLKNSIVKIKIYNESGQLVKISDKGKLSEGGHNVDLDMSNLNDGLYIIDVSVGNSSVTKKIQIIK